MAASTLKTARGLYRGLWRSQCLRHTLSIVLLMFVGQFAQGQGPGVDTTMEMKVVEESGSGVVVGTLPTRNGYTYRLERSSPHFELDADGVIRTKDRIDRETLVSDSISLFVEGTHPTESFHPIDVTIQVLDINDNAPRFDQSVVSKAFQEDAHEGQQQLIITAVDPDKGLNGTVVEYQIVSGNEDGKFRLNPPSDETPFMFIVTQGVLDRETKDSYQLNISAKDGGDSPLYGYLQLSIDITDINDNPPSFDPSDFVAEVNESADVGTSVIHVQASDDDIGENAEIYYTVIDSSGQFRIEERTGVIRTLTSPLYCSRPSCGRQRSVGSIECDPNSCLLIVESRDGGRTPQSGRAYVSVTVIDENDHDPIITFQPTTPDPVTGIATIDENASGVRVASISVTDADRGVNGQTSVQIISGNEADHFRLVSLTLRATTINYIQVKGQLDRETIPKYNLTVKAVDKGVPPRSSTAYLIIIVNDANDHAPVFEHAEYRTTMSELAMPGSYVISVKAVDDDSGPNSHLKYSIITGNNHDWFLIDEATGLVTSRVALDHEASAQVVLNISASDSTYRNFTRLIIDIQDENDMAPRFKTPAIKVDMEENKPVNQYLGTLMAEDFDSGVNGTVSYVIHPDTKLVYPDMFRVDGSSGRVTTSQALDRERTSSYTIWVIAKDGGSPSLSSTATIFLTVKDLNDNVPEFHPDSYYVNVFETDPAGVKVVQVQVEDRDAGSFGKVTYSFTGSVFNSFKVDSNTGVITTTTVLRRNVGRSYRLSVVATDGGGRRSEVEATVNVVVANINDPAPSFPSQAVTFDITEDSGEETNSVEGTVGQVQASGGGGTSVTYSITRGDPHQVFSIDASGVIRRNKVVNREEKEKYVMTVIATTGSRFGKVTVTINVRDVNDNSPVFTVRRSGVTVMENWPAGNNIFMAAAKDADSGPNAQLVYTLVSDDDPDSIFQIGQDSGIISLTKPASQISQSQVQLRVTVRDSGTPQRSSSMTIEVKVQDVNDHTPIFPHNVYTIAILESRPVNEIIMKFTATDVDEGKNGELGYRILRGNEEGRFGIFPDGTLFIAHSLDREARDMYSLMIQVQDFGDIPRSSSANITIYILDANDNVPVFSNSSYTFSVAENRPARTFVGSVKAYDSDVGQNAELLYSLVEGNMNFTIDPISGALYTRRPFDREYVMDTSSLQFYTVDVFATDGGTPRLRGKASIRVYISDVNDSPPVFARSLFSATVTENAAKGTKVIKMTATDADIGANGAVSYVIVEGNIGGVFRIGETSGEVTVDGPLDRESRDRYLLTVLATDTGSGRQLSSSAQLSISITDDNDQVPQFTSTVRQLSVVETTPIGELLTVFTGRDLDLGNNAKMYFSIFSGNDDNVFKLDGYTGKLYLLRSLDFETRQEYLLNISVSDEGYRPSLSSYIFFNVKVIDANDNAPVFRDGFKSINVREDARNEQIARLRAVDKDSGDFGEVRFAIISQDPNENLFRIEAVSGEIFVDGILDRETNDYYKLVITATDQASPLSLRLTTQKSLNIIIQDVNDNSPVFKSPPAFVVPSSKQQGQKVAEVFADDADTGENGQVSYSLLTHTSLFALHPSSGHVTLLRDLPPTPLIHTLRVVARDNGNSGQNGRKSTETTITLLLSSSESGPTFGEQPYSGTLSEDDWAGTSLFTVSATASRSGVSVEYYLTGVVSGGVQRGGVFRVDAVSGVVSSTVKLDREVVGSVVMVEVTAVEKGETTPRTTTTQATVTLHDVNDTPPRFSPSVYNVSFPEDEVKDGSVVKVIWNDPDTTGQVQLQLQGPGSRLFEVLTEGTIMATSLPLDREKQEQYTLLLSANDGVHTASATVTITVSDHNDNSPVFTQSPYYFEVPEDADIGATVARVLATDADLGENARVTYDVMSTWASDLFQLDSVLGTFTLIGSLDYEVRQVYSLRVQARDGGSPPRWGETVVYMNVVDVNDNEPEFDPASYRQLVSEDAAVGTTVINVSATDVDSGGNGEVRYSLLGDSNRRFNVDPVSGTLRTAAPLDREDQPRYDVIVLATDRAPVPGDRRSATTVVTVELRDVNDCSPQFTSPNVTSVKEETANGTVIFTLSATDLDTGVNSHVTFTLDPVPGDPSYPFVLDPKTGQLKVNTDLRRELQANYTLTVHAQDGGSPPLSSSQTLTVLIEDVNNHPPRFTSPGYRHTVAENVQVGTSLLRVEARDADEGLNGVVRYFIQSGDDSHDLSLDTASGVLRLQKQLDYERRREYRVVVRAEDSGVEGTLTGTATLVITVTDVNDFQPVFDDSPYVAYVQEGMGEGPVEVVRVRARDEDSLPNSRLAYQLRESGEDVEGVFGVEQLTGRITALVALDRERVPQYTLTVIATDSGIPRLTGTGTLTVYVKDVNDHAPQFTSSAPYVAHVMENGDGSQSVTTVTATDQDEGINAQIIYHLQSSEGGRFTVLPGSGEILTTRPLDREDQAQYQLVVVATDQGIPPQSASCHVIVYVDDVNDNAPAFEQSEYSQTISDPTNAGDFVVGVTAVDKDTGINGQVVYSLLQAEGRFHINTHTGVVTAARMLSGQDQSFTFQVLASDLGQSSLNNTVQVTVTLQQVSGSPPTFADLPADVRVAENSAPGTVLATVSATTSRSNTVSYHIVGGNVNSALAINQDNGTIKVVGLIDYEVVSSMTVWLQAKDGAPQPLSAYRPLVVTVEDRNDNLPRFNATWYQTSLLENLPLGSSVLQVSATDADDGANRQVQYQLVSGNTNTTFTIHPSTGLITTTNPVVDREGIPLYHLVVEAVDQGSPRLTSTCTVKVAILDRNDNPPVFSGLFSVAVPEDLPLHSLILTLTSTDRDTPIHAVATYALITGPDSSPFAVDPVSGNLTNIGRLDAETKERYRPEVSVSDSSFATKTQVTIRLLDVNDNAPRFLSASYGFDVQEGRDAGTLVGRLEAKDHDISSPNNEFYFSLKRPSTLFELHAESGEIRTLKSLEYQRSVDGPSAMNVHTLEVLVTDLGMPSLSSQATVTITITDANNHAPVFQHSDYSSAVPEDARRGTSILRVEANDYLDFGLNADITYSVAGGNGSSYFEVNSFSGVVSVSRALTGQRGRDFVVVVTATDRGEPPLSNSATVALTITDINTYSPEFRNAVFTKSLREDVSVGYTVDTLRAGDRDSGLNGQVRFSISQGNGEGLFAVHPTTGSLTVASALDYEVKKNHYLTIVARDLALLSREASQVYTVHVIDVNDNSPQFNQTVYNSFVAENSPQGTTIVTLQARDADTGNNAIVRYAFTGASLQQRRFSIDSVSGSVRVEGELDYESRDTYSLTVMAFNPVTSGGEPLMKNVTEVRVYVTGVNEFVPRFAQREYRKTISESALMNTTVLTLQATDPDRGVDGVVYYYLLGASNLKGFHLHPLTGDLVVVQRPDYESSPFLMLTAMAKNWGSLKGNDTDTCSINITVEDANDPPVFRQDSYIASLQEEAGRDTVVVTVSATDHDLLPENRQFLYRIEAGNDGDWFSIDHRTGRIATTGNGVLDRETVPQYRLTVVAVDRGAPPQTGSCEVVVYLLDINDNGPVFVPSQLTAYVREGQPAGTHVITLSLNTSDPDLSPNQGPYLYHLLPGPATQFFSVSNDTGVVSTRRVIHRELHELFLVPVVVYDHGGLGGNRMSSTLTFTVIVTDINNAPPQPRPLTVRVAILDGMTSVGVIADVRPLDVDVEGNYTCRIVSGALSVFSIPRACDLRMLADPDRESYSLVVAGSDGSFEEVSYTVSVQLQRFSLPVLKNAVAVLLDRMDVTPFLNTKYVAFVSAVESLFGQSSEPFVISLKKTDDTLYVYLAVQEGEGVVPQQLLAQKLRELESTLESRAGVDVKNAAVRLCTSNPCLHGGTCSTEVTLTPGLVTHSGQHLVLTSATPSLSETCDCPPAYGGDRCQTAQEPCGGSFCSHGGSCEDDVCSCPDQWTGPYCEEDVDECLSQPCHSGGQCINQEGSFACQCPPDFYGPLCQNRYHCVSRPCLHGATCRDELGGFRCQCPYGYFGDLCEGVSLGFGETSYLTVPAISEYSSLILTGYLATVSRNALLIFNSVRLEGGQDKGYLALQVVEGVLTFTFRLSVAGKAPVKVEVKGTKVNTGHWFRLEAILQLQMSSLVVQRCGDDGKNCEACDPHNKACYSSVTFPARTTAVEGVTLNVGGVEDFSSLLPYPGEIHSPGFEGCLHSLQANGRPLLLLPSALAHSHVSATCPRRSAGSLCGAYSCGGAGGGRAGVCQDRWSHVECRCPEERSGLRCGLKSQPFSFGSDSKVTYSTRESYRRQQLLHSLAGQQRQRRAAQPEGSSVSLRVRASHVSGVLFSARTADSVCVVWAEEGAVKLAMSSGQPMMVVADLLDNAWHTITLTTTATNLTIAIDNRPTLSQSRIFASLFAFDSLDVDSMTVGGATVLPNGRLFKGFEGCISEFRINGNKQPLNGTSEHYNITMSGGVGRGCGAVCAHNPCGEGFTCKPNGELYNCSALAMAAQEKSLQPGIIVVIALSILLVIAIVVIFILFQVRRGWFRRCLPAKKERESMGKDMNEDNKLTGGAADTGVHNRSTSPRYADNAQLEEMIIRNHIAEELAGQKTTSLSVRPDLIGSNLSELSQPTHFEDGTMIIENIEHTRGVGMGGEEGVPEHYDLENASSIAPSDSDIIQHYQRFRHSRDLKAHLHPNHHPHHRDRHNHPPAGPGQPLRDGAHSRQSPISVTGSALSAPARPSPLPVSSQTGRPSSALATVHQAPYGGGARNNPPHGASTNPFGARNSPRGGASSQAPRSQGSVNSAAHSLGSHHSHSSSSSNSTAAVNPPPPPPQPNGHCAPRHHQAPSSDVQGLWYSRGLTVDEVNRLNARADLKNTASMLEAVSSSSEDPHHPHPSHHAFPPPPPLHPHHHHPHHPLRLLPAPRRAEEPLDGANILLEPPDSSDSDSGANDSFTCSEFEFENDGRGARMDTPKPGFSKLPDVAEDEVPVSAHLQDRHSNGESAGSGGNVWEVDDDGGSRSGSGSGVLSIGASGLELDSMLNLGPHFHKLMGVFADIALLPDTTTTPRSTLHGPTSNDHEEYV